MTIELTVDELETLLNSIEYSREKVRDVPGTPYNVRQQNLARLDAAAAKLRTARKTAVSTATA